MMLVIVNKNAFETMTGTELMKIFATTKILLAKQALLTATGKSLVSRFA